MPRMTCSPGCWTDCDRPSRMRCQGEHAGSDGKLKSRPLQCLKRYYQLLGMMSHIPSMKPYHALVDLS